MEIKEICDALRKEWPKIEFTLLEEEEVPFILSFFEHKATNLSFEVETRVMSSNMLLTITFGRIIPNAKIYQLVNKLNANSPTSYKAFIKKAAKDEQYFCLEFIYGVDSIKSTTNMFTRAIEYMTNELFKYIKPIYQYVDQNSVELGTMN